MRVEPVTRVSILAMIEATRALCHGMEGQFSGGRGVTGQLPERRGRGGGRRGRREAAATTSTLHTKCPIDGQVCSFFMGYTPKPQNYVCVHL